MTIQDFQKAKELVKDISQLNKSIKKIELGESIDSSGLTKEQIDDIKKLALVKLLEDKKSLESQLEKL